MFLSYCYVGKIAVFKWWHGGSLWMINSQTLEESGDSWMYFCQPTSGKSLHKPCVVGIYGSQYPGKNDETPKPTKLRNGGREGTSSEYISTG